MVRLTYIQLFFTANNGKKKKFIKIILILLGLFILILIIHIFYET